MSHSGQTRLPRADPSCVDSIRSRIQQLPPKVEVEPATLSMYQLVQRLYEDILALKQLGYGAPFICQLLQDESGLPFRPSTLATYLSQEKRRLGGSRKRSRSGPGRSGSKGSAPGNSVAGHSGPGNSGAGRSGPGNASPGRSRPGGSASGRSSTAAPPAPSPVSELEETLGVAAEQEPLEVDDSVFNDGVFDEALVDVDDGASGDGIERDGEPGDDGNPEQDGEPGRALVDDIEHDGDLIPASDNVADEDGDPTSDRTSDRIPDRTPDPTPDHHSPPNKPDPADSNEHQHESDEDDEIADADTADPSASSSASPSTTRNTRQRSKPRSRHRYEPDNPPAPSPYLNEPTFNTIERD